MFSIPVTVVRPQVLLTNSLCRPVIDFPTVKYEPGYLKRYFLQVPRGATWGSKRIQFIVKYQFVFQLVIKFNCYFLDLTLKMAGGAQTVDQSSNASARFVIHAMTANAGLSCKSEEFYKMVTLNPLEESNIPFRVTVRKSRRDYFKMQTNMMMILHRKAK